MNKKLREEVFNKYNGLCAYTGKPLDDDWQVDHIEPQYKFKNNFTQGDANHIDNLVPAIRIVNHYKRAHNLDRFREYMLTFHIRLAKLPKNTKVEATKKRIAYMNTIADLFDITVDKPFKGKFYFENFT